MSPTYRATFQATLDTLTITEPQKLLLRQRYLELLGTLESRAWRVAALFHAARFIMTVGSLLVPALLSIDASETMTKNGVYWSVWAISLSVSISNGILALFKIDKRYYYVHTTLEHLVSEGWQYAGLTGKYSGFYTPGTTPSHENQFLFFCHAVEKIRMRQVEEEYYKLTDAATGAQAAAHPGATAAATLIPPTPLRGQLAHLPLELRRAVEAQLSRLQAGDGGGEESKDSESQENRSAESVPM